MFVNWSLINCKCSVYWWWSRIQDSTCWRFRSACWRFCSCQTVGAGPDREKHVLTLSGKIPCKIRLIQNKWDKIQTDPESASKYHLQRPDRTEESRSRLIYGYTVQMRTFQNRIRTIIKSHVVWCLKQTWWCVTSGSGLFWSAGHVSVGPGGAAPVGPPAGGERGSGGGELPSGWRRTWRHPCGSGASRRQRAAARPPGEEGRLQELLLEDLHLLLRASSTSSTSSVCPQQTLYRLCGSEPPRLFRFFWADSFWM